MGIKEAITESTNHIRLLQSVNVEVYEVRKWPLMNYGIEE